LTANSESASVQGTDPASSLAIDLAGERSVSNPGVATAIGEVVGAVVGTVSSTGAIGVVGTIVWRYRRKKEAEVGDIRRGLDNPLETLPSSNGSSAL
jgi:hypothetical protein